MICSSQSCSPLMMQCPMCYLHFTLATIPPNVKSEYAEKATPSICMIYQTVDKVMQLLLLKGISILHIITFTLMLHWYSVIIESNLTLPIASCFGLQKSNMPYSMGSGRDIGSNCLVFNHDQGKESVKGDEKRKHQEV